MVQRYFGNEKIEFTKNKDHLKSIHMFIFLKKVLFMEITSSKILFLRPGLRTG